MASNETARGYLKGVVAHTGLEPVVSALRGQRVSRLHQCAAADWDYSCAVRGFASCGRISNHKNVKALNSQAQQPLALAVVLVSLPLLLGDLVQVMLELLFEGLLIGDLFVGDEAHLRFVQLVRNHGLLQ